MSITSNAVNSSADTSSRAIAYGINNANSGDDPEVSVELVDTTIFAVAQAANGSTEAVGIYGGNASTTKVGEGTIYVEAVADNSESSGQAYGIYTDVGAKTLTKGWGDITVRGSSAAVGIYADDGEVSYGGGTITADISGENDDGAALGIYIGETATVSLAGDTDVNAFDALMGTGTLVVKEQTVAGFVGSVDEFTGEVLVQGVTGLGMSTLEAESYREDTDGATLVLHAGSTLTGSYTVGANAQVSAGAKSGSSLDLLSDATLIIVASEDYDGNAALVTVDSASTESSSVVRLVNSARVDEGTTIFQVDDESIAPSDFVFKTDNLLTEVVDNRIVKKSVQSVFGNDLLLKNSVTAALYGEQGEGADRVIELTSDALSTVASAAELNKIALMGAAGGSQIAASNATLMIDDSLMRHGSALAMSERDVGQAALWIDLNGSVSRANDFSVGSINYGYKSDLAGASIGADYSLGNGSFVGAALSFGTGSVRGQGVGGGTKNDVDYWAVHAYGVWNAGIANVIGSFGWLQTNNEISQSGYSGKPNASAFTFSKRVEKSFELAGGYSATPHIGVRWSHIDADNFQAGGFDYRNETIDIVSFPVGVVFSNAFNSGDVSFKPYLDLEVAPTVGDTKTNNMVSLAGSAVEDIFETRIASSVVYSARLGVVGHVGSAHAFGLSYGVSAGNGDYVSQRLKVGYRYSF